MQLFSEETELQLRLTIVELVEKTVASASNSNEPRYLRQQELMQYAGGVSKDTIRKWVSMGMKEIKIGQVIMYDKQDVDRFMNAYKV